MQDTAVLAYRSDNAAFLLKQGLQDRSLEVRKAACGLLSAWLTQQCDSSCQMLLAFLDPEQRPGELCLGICWQKVGCCHKCGAAHRECQSFIPCLLDS